MLMHSCFIVHAESVDVDASIHKNVDYTVGLKAEMHQLQVPTVRLCVIFSWHELQAKTNDLRYERYD